MAASKSMMIKQLKNLQEISHDLPQITVENILASNGDNFGNYEAEELLYRLALEVKIFRLKERISHKGDW